MRPAPPRIVLEITPPKEPRVPVLLRRAALLGPVAPVVNVIARTDRWSSLEAAVCLRVNGFDPVWHLTTRGRTIDGVERDLRFAARAGVRRVLCVRGEYKSQDSADAPRIREIVALARARLPDASIGVTINHHQRGERVLSNLLRKLDAGADFVQTQVSFDLRGLRGLARTIADRHPQVAVYPMLLPVLSPEAALRAARRLSIPLDQALQHQLERDGAEAGWDVFAERLAEVHAEPLFAGAALMTPMDPDPGFGAKLREVVERSLETR